MSGGALALAALVGALVCVERRILAQLMLARPIVVAPLVAAILGNTGVGLAVGVPMELFFLGSASYGASTPDHETLSALMAAALAAAAAGPEPAGPVVLAFAVFAALPLAPLGRRVEALLEWLNVRLVERAEAALAAGEARRAARQGLASIASVAATGAVVVLVGAGIGALAGPALRDGPGGELGTLAFPLFTGLAAGLGTRAIRAPGSELLSGVAAVTVFVVFAVTTLLLR